MNPLKELIEKLKAEGKSVEQIAAAVMLKAKELKEQGDKSVETEKANDAKGAVDMVKDYLKALDEIEKALKATDAEGRTKADSENVKKTVDEYLKTLPALGSSEQKEVKFFNVLSGKLENSKGMSEDQKAFVNLVTGVATKDLSMLKGLQKEIASQKEHDYKAMGFSSDAMKAYLYTDATTGSYMIPTEVEGMIFERAWQSRILSRVNTRAISYNAKLYPVMAQMDFAFLANEAAQLGDKTPTIDNPEIDMKRFGGLAFVSNQLLIMKGPELSRALADGFGDALARFADLYIPCASVTGNSDLFNGMVFDARSVAGTAKARAAANIQDLQELKNLLGPKWRADAIFYGNTQVRDTYGLLNSDNIPLFRNFVETGEFRPFGLEFLEVPYIPSTFDGATMRTAGTSDVLGCFNPQGVFVGFEPLRLDVSREFKFDYDLTAFRAVSRIGEAVISSSSTQGAVSSFKYLTN